ncbi:MAG: glutathione S-transferase family protein, partial [Moraxellaceae bacterium]
MIELYEFALSGNCHKVRLLLSILNVGYKSILLNSAEGEHKAASFLTKNPLGQVPVVKDGEIVIRDSQAILVYLAKAYGGENWFPNDARKLAGIMEWLSTAAHEIARGPNALRLHHKFGRDINLADATKVTDNILYFINSHLASLEWLANDEVTIADMAVYPYVALAHEGK